MAYFLLEGGKHQEREGKDLVNYKSGDVLKSNVALDKQFEGKFRKATNDEIRASKRAKIKAEEEKVRALEEEEKLEAKLSKQAVDDDDDEDIDEEENELGEDVTDEFDGAEAAGLKVFKTGRHYNIAKADAPDRAVRNGKEVTKKDARAYVQERVPEEEEAEEEAEAEDEES